MALLTQDRTTLARMTYTLSKRVADKKASRQLQSLTNKLAHGNSLGPTDTELLMIALESLLKLPPPKFSLKLTPLDYVLIVPAVRKLAKQFRVRRQDGRIRRVYQEILERL